MHVQMAVADVAERNGPAEGFHVQVGIADVSDFHRTGSGFQHYISAQSLRPQSPVGGPQTDEGGSRNQHAVIHQVGPRAAGTGAKFDPVPMLLVYQADRDGMGYRLNHYLAVPRRFDRDRTVVVGDRNHSSGSDR